MGADNWRVCPKCVAEQTKKKERMLDKARKSYGKVPAEEYERLTKEANAEPDKPGETLAEYYEMFVGADGTFTVDYGCSCRKCGWEFSFKHEQNALEAKVN